MNEKWRSNCEKLKKCWQNICEEFQKGMIRLIAWSIPVAIAIFVGSFIEDKFINPDFELTDVEIEHVEQTNMDELNARPGTLAKSDFKETIYAYKPILDISLIKTGGIQDIYLAYGYDDDSVVDEGTIYRLQGITQGHGLKKKTIYRTVLNYNTAMNTGYKDIYLIIKDSKTATKNVYLINIQTAELEYALKVEPGEKKTDGTIIFNQSINTKTNKGSLKFDYITEQEIMALTHNEKENEGMDLNYISMNREKLLRNMSKLRSLSL
ncbi:hypothetical protein [Listeria booriae]|uniref:hypothetical protein n=1 Tax=Listeria booriae TaxID=1552123 RepID=UPI00164D12A4|nr:hypothetical protein [Listeria booriae]MBC6298783.1 hypothetical protein [Listeria booriae]